MNFININDFVYGYNSNNVMFSPMQSPVTPIAPTLKRENSSSHLICDPQIGEDKPQMLSPPATPHPNNSSPHHPSRPILSLETPKKSPITKPLKVNVSNNNVVVNSTNTVDAAVADVSSPALSSSTITTTTASTSVTAPIKVTTTTTDHEEENLNPKQINRINKRRIAREKFKKKHNIPKQRKPYIHESRHIHALRRPRGPGGRFLTNSAEKVLQTYNNNNMNSTCHFDPYNTSPQQHQQQYIENPWSFMMNNMNMMNGMNMNAVDINAINAMNPYNLVIEPTDDCSSATSSTLSSPTSYHPTTITTKIDDEPIYTHDTSLTELYVLPYGATSPTTTYSSPPFVTNNSNNAVINNTAVINNAVIHNAANYVWNNSTINLI
ncbi:hypothetical protein Glove_718g41 [Diversispora epigaea]|uniref:Transcriptional activator HAP2 n=1 Tax=Diversispora epigaea TaxID=1348612 RepID=A0A397G6N2_9GLOM|nr:hypothetical protein Glove_718g41 [Diversispora epigaea]